MNALTDEPLLDVEDIRREIVARDREMDNPFTKDAQITAIRGARLYRGDRLIRVAKPAQAPRPEGGPADRGAAQHPHPQDPRRPGDRPVRPGAAGRWRTAARGCTRPARSPASAAAGCTATGRWRARSSAAASSPGGLRAGLPPGDPFTPYQNPADPAAGGWGGGPPLGNETPSPSLAKECLYAGWGGPRFGWGGGGRGNPPPKAKPADLQSAAFNHFATCPRAQAVKDRQKIITGARFALRGAP